MCKGRRVAPIGRSEGYPFVECEACGFIFVPSVGRAEVERAYRNGKTHVENGAPEEGWALNPRFLEPAFDRLGRDAALEVLDFGCGHSRVPARMRARGHRVIGVDLEPPEHPHPDRHTGDILQLELEANSFDLSYAYQVFEHLPEPRPILDELLRLTRPGGFVLIHTDMETPQRQQGTFFDWFYVLPPDHCSYYRPFTFAHTLENRPAELVWSNPWSVLIEANSTH